MELSTEELAFATKRRLRDDGNLVGSQVVDHALTPEEAERVLKLLDEDVVVVQQPYSPDEALELMMSANLTREQYNLIREGAKQKGHDLYPSYFQVQRAKKNV
jgi:hypothetical protein